MIDEVRQVGERIQALREIADLSIDAVAAALDISTTAYSAYEHGEADIPVSILYKLANILHVEMSALLTGEEPKLHIYSVVRKGKGISVERRKEYKHESLGYNFVHKKAEPFLVTVEAESEETPFALNSHAGQEFNYVLQGAVKVVVGGHEILLHEGDALFFDSGYAHGMKAIEAPAQFLAIIF